MSSRSDAINCNKVVVLTNDLSKCNGFMFDVDLDITYMQIFGWYSDQERIRKAVASTIACQIGHKYKQWKVCSYVLAGRLCNELLKNDRSLNKWKNTISVSGRYIDDESTSGYSEIIYDSFIYDGIMTMSENIQKSSSNDFLLQYTIRFFLSPVLPLAQRIYSARGYEILYDCNIPSIYKKIKDEKLYSEKKYDHLGIFREFYNASLPSKK